MGDGYDLGVATVKSISDGGGWLLIGCYGCLRGEEVVLGEEA